MRRQKLNRFTTAVVDHLALSLLWLASVLLLVTAPAGTAALCEVARLRARGDDPAVGATFLRAVRQYFLTSLLIGLGWAALGGVLAADLWIAAQLRHPGSRLLLVVLLALLLLYALVTVALFPVVVSHHASAPQLARTAVLVTLLSPGRALLGLALVAAAVAAGWAVPLSTIIAPSLTATALQRVYQGAFQRLEANSGAPPPGPPAAPPDPAIALPNRVAAART